MRALVIIMLQLLFVEFACGQTLSLKTANGHPMKYYISLPQNWNKEKTWPVVFILEAATKQFEENAKRFINARGNLPFILVAPINTNNGNQGRRDPELFPYSNETWNFIDAVGDCKFNAEGIRQIMIDVQKEFHAEDKIYITGFEAGAHDLWSIVFNHPEYLKGVAVVAGNFRDRCTSAPAKSDADHKRTLPIVSFVGSLDDYFGPNGKVYNQWESVKNLAMNNGFQNISETIVQGVGHEPMPKEVLYYFNSISR